MIDVEKETIETNKLIEVVNKDAADAKIESDKAAIQEAETNEAAAAA
jgi:hypothetical protein